MSKSKSSSRFGVIVLRLSGDGRVVARMMTTMIYKVREKLEVEGKEERRRKLTK